TDFRDGRVCHGQSSRHTASPGGVDPCLPARLAGDWDAGEGDWDPEGRGVDGSRYCLAASPVPVIVVRPDRKRAEAKSKRLANPLRHSYIEIREKSNSTTDLRALDPTMQAEKPPGAAKNYLGIFGSQKYKRLSV
ncbi:hypothetical protein PORY_000028, partial [Pneumocystis oryctolagi]